MEQFRSMNREQKNAQRAWKPRLPKTAKLSAVPHCTHALQHSKADAGTGKCANSTNQPALSQLHVPGMARRDQKHTVPNCVVLENVEQNHDSCFLGVERQMSLPRTTNHCMDKDEIQATPPTGPG